LFCVCFGFLLVFFLFWCFLVFLGGGLCGGLLVVLVFIEQGDLNSDAVIYNYARQAAEIGPSFRGRPFGSAGARNTPLFEQFIQECDDFTKTGSGQT
jgi:hypothetical protein